MERNNNCFLSTKPGNNVHMIERILLSRPWWKPCNEGSVFNLHYQETTPKFEQNCSTCIYNHMPENGKYHSKWRLYCSLEVEFGSHVHEITKPTYLYEGFHKKRFHQHFQFQKARTGVRLPCYDAECANLWIMKPLSLNRGRGIAVIRSLEEAEAHQAEFPQQKFIIQQYIEHPLLYEGRKFDIRCYSLITHGGNGYVYDCGYLRLSSVAYDELAEDMAVHLTNNEFQNKTEHYSQFEEGNMISFQLYDEYTDGQFLSVTWPQIKRLMARTQVAVGSIQGRSVNCFELIGFDFMLEQRGNTVCPVLIEANMNPCMKLASPVSRQLLPGLIDDMFQLTVDKTFPPPKKAIKQLQEAIADASKLSMESKEYNGKENKHDDLQAIRWDVLTTGIVVTRQNQFAQVMQGWRAMPAKKL